MITLDQGKENPHLVIQLGPGLPDQLEHIAELFHWRKDFALYEFHSRSDHDPEVLPDGKEPANIPDHPHSVQVFAEDIVFSHDGVKNAGHSITKLAPAVKRPVRK